MKDDTESLGSKQVREMQNYTSEQLKNDPDFSNNTIDALTEKLGNEKFDALFDLQQKLGVEVYLTGGIVRDALIGVEPKDFDFIVRIPPPEGVDSSSLEEAKKARESFENFFGQKTYKDKEKKDWVIRNEKYGTLVLEGEGFGVYKLYPPDGSEPIDIAFPRTEQAANGITGGARDFDVQSNLFLPIKEDVGRRDFTINAIVMKLEKDDSGSLKTSIEDHVGGIDDLKTGTLRAVGSAYDRLNEDHTRIMRAVRFEIQKGLVMDESLEAAIMQLVGEGALRKKRPDGKRVVPPEVMAPQFLKGLVKNSAAMVERLNHLGILGEYLPDLKEFRMPTNLPKSLNAEAGALSDLTEQNTETRIQNLDQAINALAKLQELTDEEGSKIDVDECLFLLLKDLGKNEALFDYGKDGLRHYRKEFRDLSISYVDQILKETKLNSLEAKHTLRVHPEKIKSLMHHHGEAADFLHPHYMNEHGLINQEQALQVFPELTKDPLWRVLKAEVLSSPVADQRREQIEWVESQLTNLEKLLTEKPIERIEALLSGNEISQMFFVPPGQDVGSLKGELTRIYLEHASRLSPEEFESDQEIKRIIFAQLIAHPTLRERWKPAREADRNRHVLSDEDIKMFSSEGDDRQVSGMLMYELAQRSSELYLGESLEEAAEHNPKLLKWIETRERAGSFGERFAQKLAEDPSEVLDWMSKGFKQKESAASLIFPELKKLDGCEQDWRHPEGDVWQHTKLHLQIAEERGIKISPELALASLYHDSGKPAVQKVDGDKIRFIGHQPESVGRLHEASVRLGLINSEKINMADVERAIRDHHAFYEKPNLPLLYVRRYLPDGSNDLLLKLVECDIGATGKSEDGSESENYFKSDELLTELKEKAALIDKERKFPGVFDKLYETEIIREILGAGEEEAKHEVLYEEFLNSLNGSAPSAQELRQKFLVRSEKWTKEYVKTVVAPGKKLIEYGLTPGPEIGEIQNRIVLRIVEGEDVNDRDVSALVVEKLAESIRE